MPTAILLCFTTLASLLTATPVCCSDAPRIARWYRNHEAAVSLRFDDNHDSHIATAIPLLNRHGFPATFMVIPGTIRYREHKDFWERQVPAMGHRLGNHTMNHRGARDLQEADYEIGEAARVIERIYPGESKLNVFASGGGETWGGKEWEQAEKAYSRIAEKYHQIDLYDGKHVSLRVDGSSRLKTLCGHIDRVVSENKHQPFHFHGVGKPAFRDRLRALVRRSDLTTSEETFSGFLQCLAEQRERLWIAPLIDILKYEEEVRGASLKVRTSTREGYTLSLSVQTDPALYDHKLTVILPVRKGMTVKKVFQGDELLRVYQRKPGEDLVDVRPVNSSITVIFAAG